MELFNRSLVSDPTDALTKTEDPSDSLRSTLDHAWDGWHDLSGSAGITLVAAEVLFQAEIVGIDRATGRARCAEASSGVSSDSVAIGVIRNSAAPGQSVQLFTTPGTLVPVLFETAPAAVDNGRPVFTSTTPGTVTLIPPSQPGVVFLCGVLVGANGSTLTPTILWAPQVGSAFGTEYTEGEALAEQTHDGLIYSQKLRITTNEVPAGVYRIAWNFDIRASMNNRDVGARIQLDDTDDLLIQEDIDGTDYRGLAGWRVRELTAGIHTIDVDIRRVAAMAVTVFVRNITLEIWRIS